MSSNENRLDEAATKRTAKCKGKATDVLPTKAEMAVLAADETGRLLIQEDATKAAPINTQVLATMESSIEAVEEVALTLRQNKRVMKEACPSLPLIETPWQ